MAVQIYDVIRLTLIDTIDNSTSDHNNDNDNDWINDDMMQQILKIIKYDLK